MDDFVMAWMAIRNSVNTDPDSSYNYMTWHVEGEGGYMQIITCELCDIIFHTGKCVDALHRIADTKTMLSIIRISQSYHFERDFTSFPGLYSICNAQYNNIRDNVCDGLGVSAVYFSPIKPTNSIWAMKRNILHTFSVNRQLYTIKQRERETILWILRHFWYVLILLKQLKLLVGKMSKI